MGCPPAHAAPGCPSPSWSLGQPIEPPQTLKQEIERRSQAQGLKVSEAMRHTLQAQAVSCLAWQREGLGSPPAVLEATEAYRLEQDRLGQFLADCTVPAPQGSVRAADLYRAYERWCRNNGEQPMSGTAFGGQMAERGVAKTRDRTGLRYQGLALAGRSV